MEACKISFGDTGSFQQMISDYLEGSSKLDGFYKYSLSLDSFKKIIEDKKNDPFNRNVLTEVLREQYENLPQSAELKSAIASLSQPDTYTITTGHQLNLFTGPLYFIYKIATAIKLAQEVAEKNPSVRIVPVYWMATEDHDFEEINHIELNGKKISWNMEAKGATGRLATPTLKKTIEELRNTLGLSDLADELVSMYENAYLAHSTLADATRALVNELFGKYGLVVLDADHPKLKSIFKPYIKEDLLRQTSYHTVSSAIEKIKQEYPVQVNPRELNFFYLRDQYRERLLSEGERFFTVDERYSFSKEELLAELDAHPEYFSPNVITRPLYEEVILPNLAYIGGPAEIAYWFELKEMFEAYQINFPMLVLRNCFMIVDQTSYKQIRNLSFEIKDLFLPEEALAKKYILNTGREEVSLANETEALAMLMQSVEDRVSALDITLKASVRGESTRFIKRMEVLEKKMIRSKKRKHEDQLRQIHTLKEKLFPHSKLQERSENISKYYLAYGACFSDLILSNTSGLNKNFTVLYEI